MTHILIIIGIVSTLFSDIPVKIEVNNIAGTEIAANSILDRKLSSQFIKPDLESSKLVTLATIGKRINKLLINESNSIIELLKLAITIVMFFVMVWCTLDLIKIDLDCLQAESHALQENLKRYKNFFTDHLDRQPYTITLLDRYIKESKSSVDISSESKLMIDYLSAVEEWLKCWKQIQLETSDFKSWKLLQFDRWYNSNSLIYSEKSFRRNIWLALNSIDRELGDYLKAWDTGKMPSFPSNLEKYLKSYIDYCPWANKNFIRERILLTNELVELTEEQFSTLSVVEYKLIRDLYFITEGLLKRISLWESDHLAARIKMCKCIDRQIFLLSQESNYENRKKLVVIQIELSELFDLFAFNYQNLDFNGFDHLSTTLNGYDERLNAWNDRW
jgi:hypothetical protein